MCTQQSCIFCLFMKLDSYAVWRIIANILFAIFLDWGRIISCWLEKWIAYLWSLWGVEQTHIPFHIHRPPIPSQSDRTRHRVIWLKIQQNSNKEPLPVFIICLPWWCAVCFLSITTFNETITLRLPKSKMSSLGTVVYVTYFIPSWDSTFAIGFLTLFVLFHSI